MNGAQKSRRLILLELIRLKMAENGHPVDAVSDSDIEIAACKLVALAAA